MTNFVKKSLTIAALIAMAAGLGACAEEEQNRVLQYKKGTYLGKTDQKLSQDQLLELGLRSNGQRVY
jgi:hypothetical protein